MALQKAEDPKLAGGKAVALGAMLRSGFRVPDGFVVTTAATHPLPPLVEQAILRWFDSLGARFVAVRSSAVAEDGATAAWAGQFETFLNVSRDTLLERIRDCQASAGSDRAKSYAEQHGLASGAVAVVVQAMVDSEVSGVAFSVHPVTQAPTHIVIEAGLGLGEAVVSGEITPDTHILDKSTGAALETHISHQTRMLVRDEAGGMRWQDTGTVGDAPKLSARQLAELADTVRRLEDHFGHAVDVEWGYAGDTLFVLQCRPITTLAG